MDPYIEAQGPLGDFHHELIGEIERCLSEEVPERYLVRLNKRSYVRLAGPEGKSGRSFLQDVRVATGPSKSRKRGEARSSTPIASPSETGEMTIQAFVIEEHREAFIEIFEDDPDRQLVTCIEMLSPSNKRKKSRGRKLYLRKRQSLLLGTANLVEIDLLRGGHRMPMLGEWPDSPYTLLVCRQHRAPYCSVWRAHYREPLPVLPIPLLYPDPDIRIDLQPLIAAIYTRSRYQRDIDYRKPLDPPLPEADAAWLLKRLKGR
jgi:hypothetical protein